ncbi:PREDICTED: adenylyltransferase and sulfurtransferase MOCS3 isoform X3 [Papilio xuthus]|uniref:Adenylyltransferase and sulfurtransferase MOCS3 isoform X3 n=1 Tax=Papilio xuthus TaxID=66420 RepID=A0AAJ6Z219_PAPXU|nr:PREDICTED: adenylyltransferase and sulfurtransferase MOCS3 isoform X3 [Papilio xuthus]
MEQIQRLEQEIDHLRKTLQEKENELFEMKRNWMPMESNDTQPEFTTLYSRNESNVGKVQYGDKLPKWAIERYSRQILLPDIGVAGQEKLCKAKVLIVGAGGLGCPAAVYLAGAGVGEIGIIDYDKVDLTNIHRQILHAECDQNKSKAVSAAETLKSINSNIKITPYMLQLDSSNALDIISKYDVILDCTDNVPTRYLLNDACVMNKLPLISGSALKMEGQLTIYGYRSGRNQNEKELYQGGCYRCLFPNPPPAETVGSCSANGVAGPIPGVIGALQSLEAIKLIVGQTRDKLLVERFLIFDGDDVTFRTVKLRSRDPNCPMCSENPKITNLIDYEVFCKSQAKEKKKQEPLKSQRRHEEKQKRMKGRSYYGFRTTDGDKKKYIQDVLKSERKIGNRCKSEYCARRYRFCSLFTEEKREEIFNYFWNQLDWKVI